MKTLDEFKARIHRFLNGDLAVILTYHSVVDQPLAFNLWTHLPLGLFEEHMAFLSRTTTVLSLDDLLDGLRRKQLPRHAVAITFDDGFRNNFTRAYPVLRRFNLPATIFLTTGFIGTNTLLWPERLAYQLIKTSEPKLSTLGQTLSLATVRDRSVAFNQLTTQLKALHPLGLMQELQEIERVLRVPYVAEDPLFQEWQVLDWDQIHTMAAGGLVTFGGHTADHHILARLSEREAWDQIARCRQTLDERLDRRVDLWAYPNGTPQDFNDVHEQMVKDLGFVTAFRTDPEYVSVSSDLRSLGRVSVVGMSTDALRHAVINRDRWRSLDRKERLQTVFSSLSTLFST